MCAPQIPSQFDYLFSDAKDEKAQADPVAVDLTLNYIAHELNRNDHTGLPTVKVVPCETISLLHHADRELVSDAKNLLLKTLIDEDGKASRNSFLFALNSEYGKVGTTGVHWGTCVCLPALGKLLLVNTLSPTARLSHDIMAALKSLKDDLNSFLNLKAHLFGRENVIQDAVTLHACVQSQGFECLYQSAAATLTLLQSQRMRHKALSGRLDANKLTDTVNDTQCGLRLRDRVRASVMPTANQVYESTVLCSCCVTASLESNMQLSNATIHHMYLVLM